VLSGVARYGPVRWIVTPPGSYEEIIKHDCDYFLDLCNEALALELTREDVKRVQRLGRRSATPSRPVLIQLSSGTLKNHINGDHRCTSQIRQIQSCWGVAWDDKVRKRTGQATVHRGKATRATGWFGGICVSSKGSARKDENSETEKKTINRLRYYSSSGGLLQFFSPRGYAVTQAIRNCNGLCGWGPPFWRAAILRGRHSETVPLQGALTPEARLTPTYCNHDKTVRQTVFISIQFLL